MRHDNDPARDFEAYRPLLEGIAYRMLGSHADAEDVVQETYLRWAADTSGSIRSPRSWLVTVCTRLALDHLKKARVQREQYVGPWLPEPLVVTNETPADRLSLDESVSMALLVVLERLSPAERAAFLLSEVFEYSFGEIAEILGKTPAACRKLASRARSRIGADKPRFVADVADHRRLLASFFEAARSGDLDRLQGLLSEDVIMRSDGGGKATAALKAIEGRDHVARFFAGIMKRAAESGEAYQLENCWFNGAPGLIAFQNGVPVSAFSLTPGRAGIEAIFVVRNPDKLVAFRRSET